ncbi:MAG: cytochrome d ubiquinol oxidase subunit II [Proteobacteria bacterium]|nr:cytochrome d ubiquinol oxidase subunit II [Pseudomonadota bacterium]
MILDYVTLKLIWWVFISALFVFFFVFGGWDFGACILLPILGKNDNERRLIINSIGPTWEGNQVWLITAAGATFAAWPIVYATAFSGLYYALFLVLLALVLRPPGIDFRSKIPNGSWRSLWDWSLFLSGFIPTLVFGVGLGNLLLGIPFYFDKDLHVHYQGSFVALLNPFAILFGLSATSIIALHGGLYLQKKLPKEFTTRLKKYNAICALSFVVLFVAIGCWLQWGISGFMIDVIAPIENNLIPTQKQVSVATAAWLSHYHQYALLWLIPLLTILTACLAAVSSIKNWAGFGFFMSTMAIICALLTVNVAMYPFILPSSVNPNHSITLWDAVSSHRTLHYMFWVTIIFLPIVLAYTAWVFKVMSGRLQTKTLDQPEAY